MSTDPSTGEDQVERALLAALHQRASVDASPEDDDELISAAVAAHLDVVRFQRRRKSVTPWLAAAGLLAAAAAVTWWLLPAGSGDITREASTVAQVDPSVPTQAMWVLEHRDTPLEGVVTATARETCGIRANARACLTPGSRGAFEPDGNLQLHDGTARVEAEDPIVVSLAGVRVQATTVAADFSATRRARAWTVSVERGTVTVTGPDGASQVLEAGESAGSDPPDAAVPVAAIEPAEPEAADPLDPPKPSPKQPVPSADELLTLARSQRAARNFSAAASTYEQLVAAYPTSPKVRATLVSLAQLYQGPLDDPAKALRHFDEYLDHGGPLAEDAHHGKIRALRSLGRATDAKAEVDAFLSKYPNSAHADALRDE
ncbi:tetratricopeptide repeat protein [Enhygromyxa salina]|uniref:Outer membrane lipoprotein BamD-like domain-containing protein n=1 Tax=Enhygromyxa salina TaxID=215803 RepID=A0A2S9Y0T6_9BACT|nr:tetratricopeptide repeat protein [Enhygromyxa salina]PRP98590.1 hypothetical protein ENSA7_65330 [Enhygromyxa salina]